MTRKTRRIITAKKQDINHGKELEERVARMLEDAGIPYQWENTLYHKGRKKGGIDFKTDTIWIECKHFTDRLTYKVNSEDHDIKWSQVCMLNNHNMNGQKAGFIVRELRDRRILWLPIKSFLKHYISSKKKSITVDELEGISTEIKDMEWIK